MACSIADGEALSGPAIAEDRNKMYGDSWWWILPSIINLTIIEISWEVVVTLFELWH